jgi:hypothetical protein
MFPYTLRCLQQEQARITIILLVSNKLVHEALIENAVKVSVFAVAFCHIMTLR